MPDDNSRSNDFDILSKKDRVKLFSSQVSKNNGLSAEEIKRLFDRYFSGGVTNTLSILNQGLKYAFYSPNPMITAGIYYRNMKLAFPEIPMHVESQLPNMFKNMILDRGDTNIHIESYDHYLRVKNEFESNFALKSPADIEVFNAIIENKLQILSKISVDFSYFYKINDIISNMGGCDINLLSSQIMSDHINKIDKIKIKKQFVVDPDVLEKLDYQISLIEERIAKMKYHINMNGEIR